MDDDRSTPPARTDFYTLAHKSLRKRLFDALVLAGATDVTDAVARTHAVETVATVVRAAREHAGHEDEFLHPLLDAALPELGGSLHTDHAALEGALDDVDAAFATGAAIATTTAWHAAYRALARFIGLFLAHLEVEEATQPQLWARVDEAALAAAMDAFVRSRTRDQTLASWRGMFPVMNTSERAALLRGVRARATEPMAAAALAIAEEVLDAPSWRALQGALAG